MLQANLDLKPMDEHTITFVLVSQNGNGTSRLNTETSRSEPEYLNIKHDTIGKGTALADRHLVQFQKTVLVDGVPALATVNFTMTLSRQYPDGETVVKDLVAEFFSLILPAFDASTDWADQAALDAILRGES